MSMVVMKLKKKVYFPLKSYLLYRLVKRGGKRRLVKFFNWVNETDPFTYSLICSDCHRYFGKNDIMDLIRYYKSDSYKWQIGFRMAGSKKSLVREIGKKIITLSKCHDRIQIYPHTKIGFGLYIGHGGPIIINPTAVIGNNCNLSQFTTIGSNEEQAAVIGDNVYIGPNCCLVENVRIGDNCTIGAGSVVTKDIPDNATAAGNYAKVLNFNNPGRYIINRWEV